MLLPEMDSIRVTQHSGVWASLKTTP